MVQGGIYSMIGEPKSQLSRGGPATLGNMNRMMRLSSRILGRTIHATCRRLVRIRLNWQSDASGLRQKVLAFLQLRAGCMVLDALDLVDLLPAEHSSRQCVLRG